MRRAAGDADAAGDRRVRADPAVVPDLDLVVELDVVLDHRVVDARRGRSSCWRRSRRRRRSTTRADLRDLEPAPVVLGHAEAVGADRPRRCARCVRGPIDAARRRRVTRACRSASSPIDAPAPIDAAGADRARARRSTAPAPITACGADRRAMAATCAPGVDDGGRMHARRTAAGRMQDRRDLRVGRVGIGGERAWAAPSPPRSAGATITAAARVAASWLRYFGLARNAMAPGPAARASPRARRAPLPSPSSAAPAARRARRA